MNMLATTAVPNTYVRILLHSMPELSATLLHGTGLHLSQLQQSPTIQVGHQWRILLNAERLMRENQVDDWALAFGWRINSQSHGPLSIATITAPTLGEGLDILRQYAPIRTPFNHYMLTETAEELQLHFSPDESVPEALYRPLSDIVVLIIYSFINAVLGKGTAQIRVFMQGAAPADAAKYLQYFTHLPEFSAATTGVAIPIACKNMPSPLSDEKTHQAALWRCREALAQWIQPHDTVARTEHWLAQHFDRMANQRHAGEAALPQLKHLAQHLCVSPRTLMRQLAAQGTSFRALREGQQILLAQKLLHQASYRIGDIAYLLGYGDTANFGRAFRRMSGKTPSQYRRGS